MAQSKAPAIFAAKKAEVQATLRPTPPPGLPPPQVMQSGEKKFEGPWLGLNSKERRAQVQFGKCLATVLRHGHFKGSTVTITSDGCVLLDEISKALRKDPAEIVQVLVWPNNS